MKSLDKLKEFLNRIDKLGYIVTILRWEMDTTAPKKSYDYLIDVSTKYEMEMFELATSDEFINLINDVINDNEFSSLPEEEQIYVKNLKEDYERTKRADNVPATSSVAR